MSATKKNLPSVIRNDHSDEPDKGRGSGTETLVRPRVRVSKPSLFKVILLNDDFTPMDFVIHVLKKFFGRTDAESTRIMLQVHNEGSGVAGVYSHEIAETKVYLVNDYSRKNEHPLKCVMEKSEC